MEERILLIIRKKMRLLIFALAIALSFYFILPLSIIFIPNVMNRTSLFDPIPWAWFYAFLQFPLVWIFGWLYHRISRKMQGVIEKVHKEEKM